MSGIINTVSPVPVNTTVLVLGTKDKAIIMQSNHENRPLSVQWIANLIGSSAFGCSVMNTVWDFQERMDDFLQNPGVMETLNAAVGQEVKPADVTLYCHVMIHMIDNHLSTDSYIEFRDQPHATPAKAFQALWHTLSCGELSHLISPMESHSVYVWGIAERK